jgi:hypothetical protein
VPTPSPCHATPFYFYAKEMIEQITSYVLREEKKEKKRKEKKKRVFLVG